MKLEAKFEREVIDLSGFWHFKVDPEQRGEREEWYKASTFDWDKLYVPASWNEQSTEYTWYMGKAWYSRGFWVPKDWEDKLILIGFEGVNYRAKVWVNGQFLGEHEGGFTPFAFRTGHILNFGGENRVVVLVDDTLSTKTIPPGEGMNRTYFDFFHYGGIHRDVYLRSVPKLHIRDVTIRTGIKGGDGVVDVEAVVLNEEEKGASCDLVLQVLDEGMVVSEKTVKFTIAAHAEKSVKDRLIVKGAKFWSVGSPHLYLMRKKLTVGGSVKDALDTRFGIRTVKVERGRILLNGRPVFLKGFGRHEDFPILGKALTGAILRKDYGLMKEVGANSFRTSHYPYSRTHLDLADENGFLVILELPTVGIRTTVDLPWVTQKLRLGKGLDRLDDPEMIEKAKKMLREMINRDKNRPSVIMYSLFNEPSSDREDFRVFLKELRTETEKLDPTRPITFTSHTHLEDKALDLVDVLCHNFYFGWYQQCGNLEEAEKVLDETLEQLHRKYPEKPIIVSEFGADAVAGFHADPPEMWSEEYQAELIKTYWRVLTSKEYVVGGHIWNFADFRVGQSPRRTMLNRKGIFTRTRDPKLAVGVVKKLFTETPTYP